MRRALLKVGLALILMGGMGAAASFGLAVAMPLWMVQGLCRGQTECYPEALFMMVAFPFSAIVFLAGFGILLSRWGISRIRPRKRLI